MGKISLKLNRLEEHINRYNLLLKDKDSQLNRIILNSHVKRIKGLVKDIISDIKVDILEVTYLADNHKFKILLSNISESEVEQVFNIMYHNENINIKILEIRPLPFIQDLGDTIDIQTT